MLIGIVLELKVQPQSNLIGKKQKNQQSSSVVKAGDISNGNTVYKPKECNAQAQNTQITSYSTASTLV